MINKEMYHLMVCDNCDENYEDGNGFAAFNSEIELMERAMNDEWIEKDDKHYCPKCYHIEDDDTITISPQTKNK